VIKPSRPRIRWRVILFTVVAVLLLLAAGVHFVMLSMPGKSHRGPLPPLTKEQAALRDALSADLRVLSVDIGARDLQHDYARLREAADFVEASLLAADLRVERQTWSVRGREVSNVIGEIAGTGDGIVVVGGHYDAVPVCPGANDNGTGVVATLALARAFAGTAPERTLRFVGFVNEEPPYFQTSDMGSLVYAKACAERGDDVVAMLSLETIGCYSDEKGSQRYPFPIGLLYPSTGDFVAFVANLGSRSLVRRAIGTFRAHAAFPSEGAAAPSWVTGVGWSDHWSFWKAGYPAVMVTDTALFRYDAYHTPADTIDRIDFDRLARVVDGLLHVVADLAGLPPAPEGR